MTLYISLYITKQKEEDENPRENKNHKTIIMGKILREGSQKPPVSVLQADKVFVKMILSRNSSVGNRSSRLKSFRTTAEVPFDWESEPGKPKDPPKRDSFSDPPVDRPPFEEAPEFHAPPCPPPRAAGKAASQQAKVRFWRKLIDKGQKTVKKVRQKPLALPSFKEVARGSIVFGGLDGILPKSDYHESFNSSMASSSFNYSSSMSSPSNSFLALKRSSKLQTFARACIKWAF